MADITRESFDATKNFRKVLFQRARDVLDSELNEAQDIARQQHADVGVDLSSNGVLEPTAFRLIGGVDQDVTVTAGAIYVQGQRYNLTADTLLSTFVGAANPLVTKSVVTEYDWVYADFQEVEIDAVADPTLAIAALGETTRRRKLQMTVGVAYGSEPGSAPGAGPLIQGGVQRVVLGRIYRPLGQGMVNTDEIQQYTRPAFNVEALFRSEVIFNASQNCAVGWDSGTEAFSIGAVAAWESGTSYLEALHPSGGSIQEIYGTWTLANGQVLCWRPIYFNDFAAAQMSVVSSDTTPINADTYDSAIGVQNLGSYLGAASQYVALAVRFGSTIYLRDGTTITATGTRLGWGVTSRVAPLGTVTDNRLVRTDGTSGRVLQQSPVSCDDSGNLSGVADATISGEVLYSAPKSRSVTINGRALTQLSTGNSVGTMNDGSMGFYTNNDTAYLDLALYLPDGASLVSVDMLINPGAARAGANRTYVAVGTRTVDWTPASPSAGTWSYTQEYDDTTTDLQVVTVTPASPIVCDKTAGVTLNLVVGCGNDANANPDVVHAFQLNYTMPGPSNT